MKKTRMEVKYNRWQIDIIRSSYKHFNLSQKIFTHVDVQHQTFKVTHVRQKDLKISNYLAPTHPKRVNQEQTSNDKSIIYVTTYVDDN